MVLSIIKCDIPQEMHLQRIVLGTFQVKFFDIDLVFCF